MLLASLLSCGAPAPDPAACHARAVAVFARDPDPRHSPPEVVADLACACDGAAAGTPAVESCTTLAVYHRDGIHGPADPSAAFARFRRGCDLGDGWGCNGVGMAHRKGLGAAHDAGAALAAWRKGCEAPVPSDKACSNAGNDLFQGRTGIQDFAEALRLFEQGCALGDAVSCNQAAVTREVDAYRLANGQRCVETSDPAACANFAVTLPPGHADRRLALGIACDLGQPVGCELLRDAP